MSRGSLETALRMTVVYRRFSEKCLGDAAVRAGRRAGWKEMLTLSVVATKPQPVLQEVLKLGWSFSVVSNQKKRAGPLYLGTCQSLATGHSLGKDVSLGKVKPHWEGNVQ